MASQSDNLCFYASFVMVPGVYLLPGQISIVSFTEHCLFMLLLSVTSILTYGVSVPLV